MTREIVVNASFGETRAAVLEDRRLVELFLEREAHHSVAGNIYKGRVENVLPGMQAAFVNIGLERNAFLYVDDALAHLNGSDEMLEAPRPRSIDDVLTVGQEIVVQVVKEPIGTKGARVVTNLTIPGRYLVLMPTVDHIALSRRITDEEERQRLKEIAKQIRPQGMGLIVRTLAVGKSAEVLAQDCRFLVGVWEKIQRLAATSPAPALLYQDYDLVHRLVRDEFTPDVSRFVVDDETVYKTVLELLSALSPSMKPRVYLYTGKKPIFEFYDIESQLERSLQRKVWLESGGYIVIDHTEALTSIDVNTGRFIGSTNLADTVLRTNLEAAVEIARQVRLRDIGGIIIIDFIDMESDAHRRQVLEALERALEPDRTRSHVLGFTSLGLVEMTRKKVAEDIGARLQRACPYCDGSGRVLSEETVAHKTQRELERRARVGGEEAFLVTCNPLVAAQIIGPNGTLLRRLEERTGKAIYVKGAEGMHIEDVEIAAGPKAELEQRALPVREGQVLDMQVQEPHLTNPKDGIARIEGYVIDIEGAGRYVGQKLQVEITKVFRTYAKGRVRSV
ncbi:MAG: ribonuclease G [Firmicutes bacterium ZCTH02-B6]|nr:MAG: ribonuclease G [Firmicutes bacterium ZCTH02-B6]